MASKSFPLTTTEMYVGLGWPPPFVYSLGHLSSEVTSEHSVVYLGGTTQSSAIKRQKQNQKMKVNVKDETEKQVAILVHRKE